MPSMVSTTISTSVTFTSIVLIQRTLYYVVETSNQFPMFNFGKTTSLMRTHLLRQLRKEAYYRYFVSKNKYGKFAVYDDDKRYTSPLLMESYDSLEEAKTYTDKYRTAYIEERLADMKQKSLKRIY